MFAGSERDSGVSTRIKTYFIVSLFINNDHSFTGLSLYSLSRTLPWSFLKHPIRISLDGHDDVCNCIVTEYHVLDGLR